MSTKDIKDMDDAEFDALMQGNGELAELLRAIPQPQASADLDARILAQAEADLLLDAAKKPEAANDAAQPRSAVRPRSFISRWKLPLGLAAMIMLGLPLAIMQWNAPPPSEMSAQIAHAPAAAPPAAAPAVAAGGVNANGPVTEAGSGALATGEAQASTSQRSVEQESKAAADRGKMLADAKTAAPEQAKAAAMARRDTMEIDKLQLAKEEAKASSKELYEPKLAKKQVPGTGYDATAAVKQETIPSTVIAKADTDATTIGAVRAGVPAPSGGAEGRLAAAPGPAAGPSFVPDPKPALQNEPQPAPADKVAQAGAADNRNSSAQRSETPGSSAQSPNLAGLFKSQKADRPDAAIESRQAAAAPPLAATVPAGTAPAAEDRGTLAESGLPAAKEKLVLPAKPEDQLAAKDASEKAKAWLHQIEKLIRQDKQKEALEAWGKFRKSYPDYPVSKQLLEKIAELKK